MQIIQMRGLKQTIRLIVGVMLLTSIVLTGCTSFDMEESVTYIEPAWMAEQRLNVEEFQDEMVRCMEPFGVATERTMSGEVALSAPSDPETGETDPAVVAAAEAALSACYRGQISEPKFWLEPVDSVAYQKVLDVAACLRSEGFKLSEAPSESVWLQDVAAGKFEQWSPYRELDETGQFDDFTQTQLLELASTCPQTAHANFSLSVE